jgi:hypothetical protein
MTPTPEERAIQITEKSWNTHHKAFDVEILQILIATALREARNADLEEAAGVALASNVPFAESPAKVVAAAILALKDKSE